VSPVPSPGAKARTPIRAAELELLGAVEVVERVLDPEAAEQQQPVVDQVLQPRAVEAAEREARGLAFCALLRRIELAVQRDQLEGVDADRSADRRARRPTRQRQIVRRLLLARAEQLVVEMLVVERDQAEQVEVARADDGVQAVQRDRSWASPLRLTSSRSSSSL
jgi:hypothetical protein